MVESWQDPPRSWKDYNRILARFWYDLGKIMVESCLDCVIHGKIMIESWQDCDKILARTIGGILARSWWDLDKIFQDHGKVMIEYWQYCDICDRFDQGSLYLYLWMSKNTADSKKYVWRKIMKDLGKILTRISDNLGKILASMARFTNLGKILVISRARSCQD